MEIVDEVQSFTDHILIRLKKDFLNASIDPFHGKARFKDANTIKINEDELEARYIAIATGTNPAKLNIEGEAHLITSE
ncbi:MAG: hypothetical protein KatS3mg003_1735 [Candidatus Nitrosocaldaceae archaeon]|nr:MAG: hypothetical protein KatS3mg003_1735 [Candidatus Nitrosocaldaceae archaeon]